MRKRLAIIACGSREFGDHFAMSKSLDTLLERRLDCVIHPATPGAALIACEWAREKNIQRLAMPGAKGAESDRDERMIAVLKCLEACGYDVEVHAWPLEDEETKRTIRSALREGLVISAHKVGAAA